jgi:hypothetical protein
MPRAERHRSVPMVDRNEGIIVSGRGSLTADQVAVGRKARAQKTVSGDALAADALRELQEKVEALVLALKQHEAELPQAHELTDAAEGVAREIGGGKPNKLTVTALLDAIAARAKSLTDVVSAVAAVKNLVAAFL